MRKFFSLFNFIHYFAFSTLFSLCYAGSKTIDLTIAYKTVHFAGKTRRAIAVNGQIPGPTLHFTEGDTVSITVHNHIDRGTSIHWHGLILPWKMDGVDGVTQKAIPPGGDFHYTFTLKQHGTYWYHSHSEFQEQEGVYGAMIIDPIEPVKPNFNNVVVVLSDWSNTPSKKVYANLKKEGDFYSLNFPMQASLAQFLTDYNAKQSPAEKKSILNAYSMMQRMRMSIYDLSDVSYDAYLLNGHTITSPWKKRVRVGETVRLRFIGAGASTTYRVKVPGNTLQLIQADGNAIKPYTVRSFTLAPGETFDALLTITKNTPYVIYAESIDGLGKTIGVLTTQKNQQIPYNLIQAFPKPKPTMMMNHHGHTMKPSHHSHMASSSLSSVSKYKHMQSLKRSNDPNIPVETIRMKLGGYMDRFIWFLNGVPFYKAKPIMITHGHRYRLIFSNNTMMHHPMHIHGHWFILRNGHGDHDPKLHTIDVPPGAVITADFDADESGQWFFHCHNLIHMKAGMANVFRYKETPTQEFSGLSGHKESPWHYATDLDLNADFFNQRYEGSLETLIGSDYNKLQIHAEDTELDHGRLTNANVDVFYWRLLNQFWAITGGLNYVYRPTSTPYLQPGVGIQGTFPYFIQLELRAYLYNGSGKLDLALTRDTQLTHRVFLRLSGEAILATKTLTSNDIGSGLNSLQWTIRPYYQLNPNVALYIQYQHTNYYAKLRQILLNRGDSDHENSYSIGLELLL